MSFYKRQPAMGFAWIAPVVGLVGGAMRSTPVGGNQYIEAPASNNALVAVGALAGLSVIGGLVYLVMKDGSRSPRRRRS